MSETVAVAVRNLTDNPPHRTDILDPNYTRVGVGYAEASDGMRYYTIMLSISAPCGGCCRVALVVSPCRGSCTHRRI